MQFVVVVILRTSIDAVATFFSNFRPNLWGFLFPSNVNSALDCWVSLRLFLVLSSLILFYFKHFRFIFDCVELLARYCFFLCYRQHN